MKRIPFTSLTVVILAAIGVALWFAMTAFRGFQNDMADRYAGMQVGHLISEHVSETKQWPRQWSDLRPQYDNHFEGDAIWQDMQQRIIVDWSADLPSLISAKSSIAPPFPVVRCVSGKVPGPTAHHEANFVIYETLRELSAPTELIPSTPRDDEENSATKQTDKQ